ncbi:MAG: glutathione S-transferase family protein [Rhizobiaceae bacterium]
MADITLFGNRHSGHSYKVRLFLALTNTPHSYETIDLMQPRAERSAHFRENARYNEVPLLIVDGQSFVQSNAILLYLAEKFGTMDGGTAQPQVVEWLMWEQSRIGSSLPNLRFERKFKNNTDPAVLSWLEGRLRDDLDVLKNHLAEGTGFMVADEPTIADCATAGYLYWLDDAGFEIEDWPQISAWLTRMSQLEGWQHPDMLMV